jgi:hypothetical protein
MPVKFYFVGQPVPVLFSQEALVDPSYRGQGLSYKLVRELSGSNRFVTSLWHNDGVVKIQKGVGFSLVGNYKPLKKIYNFEKILSLRWKHPYLVKLINTFIKGYFKRRPSHQENMSDYEVRFVQKCGKEYDTFFADVAPKLGILSDRTSEMLNWRYIDIPYKRYLFLEVRKKEILSGYFVLRIEEQPSGIRKGVIVDLLLDPDEPGALRCLLSKSEEIFSENKVDFSVCLVTPGSFRNIFKKAGYYEARSKKTDSLWICNEDKSPDRVLARDMKNWFITYGESDGDMW